MDTFTACAAAGADSADHASNNRLRRTADAFSFDPISGLLSLPEQAASAFSKCRFARFFLLPFRLPHLRCMNPRLPGVYLWVPYGTAYCSAMGYIVKHRVTCCR